MTGKGDGEHAREAEGHVGIAGKIEVQLKGVAEDADPGAGEAKAVRVGVEGVGHGTEAIGEQDFFAEPEEEPGDADGEVVAAEAGAAVCGELRHHLAVVDDGACDEVGEEGDEEDVGEEILAGCNVLREVDEIGDLGEGEEGDAKREDDVGEVVAEEADVVEPAEHGEEVLEPDEQAEVDGDGGNEDFLLCTFLGAGYAEGEEVVDEDGGDEKEDVGGVPVAVKEKRGQGEPGKERNAAETTGDLKAEKGDGQKQKEEGV